MSRILILLLLCAYPIDGYSQTHHSRTFIQTYFGETAKLVYRDRLDTYQIDCIKSALKRDTLYGVDAIVYDSSMVLILSPQERAYINQALTELAGTQWGGDLFTYGKVVSKDSSDAIFNDPKRRGWSYFNQYYGASLYEFSNPIFIRDNTLCIFYSGYSCAYECGEGSLAIFKQERGHRSLWLKLYTWMS